MSRFLIVLPDDSARPVLDAINRATKSLRIKMFVFSDPVLLNAVIAAQQRGVEVRVMLNPARRTGESENEEARARLTEAGVEVLDSNPAFGLTHEKSMVVDDTQAFVKSLNWATENFTETRDYAVGKRRSPRLSAVSRRTGAERALIPGRVRTSSGVPPMAGTDSLNSSMGRRTL